MADDNTDQSQKTEEPTQKKLDDARKKGQVATSREVNNWFIILAGTIIVAMISPSMSSGIMAALRKYFESAHAIPVEKTYIANVLAGTAADIGYILIVPILLLVVAAVASGTMQNGLIFAVDRIQPKMERISPMAGIKRLFSLKSVAEFLKGLAKISVVAAVATMLMLPSFSGLEQLVRMDTILSAQVLHSLVTKLLFGVLSVVTIIAAIDFLYQRFEHMKQMRMSRQEIKDEFKQSDGDPAVKQRLRQIRHDRARQRMAAAVPEASVVITNPTHFAVALKYEFDDMDAPTLVAKGQDFMAKQIRDIATEHDIPIVENPPLARALYAGVEIDQEIPHEHFKAVAEIIGYVMRLKGKMPARQ
jgi:flagellar biosynthetic protein FlhB